MNEMKYIFISFYSFIHFNYIRLFYHSYGTLSYHWQNISCLYIYEEAATAIYICICKYNTLNPY